jgi:elongator complex protein 3
MDAINVRKEAQEKKVDEKEVHENYYKDLITAIKQEKPSKDRLMRLKVELARKHKLPKTPTDIEVQLHTPIQDLEVIRPFLINKPVRTGSGVAPIAIMTKPDKCPHGKCTFCPGGIGSVYGDVPQSYTGHEPATMRGMRNDYDAYLQVMNRLEQYVLLGHEIDKAEIIVMGGTFPATPPEYQEKFVYGAFKAMNDFSTLFFNNHGSLDFQKFKDFFELPGEMHNEERKQSIHAKMLAIKNSTRTTLEQEQEKNETAKVKCVALCIETKPDWGFLEHGNTMLKLGCTRVELGIESVYDDVLKKTHRGHTAEDSKKSIRELRNVGFKINFHYMPGLPLTDKERDEKGMEQLFSDPDYRPDMIKMYPCMVAPGTPLYQEWKKGTFTPITTQEASERILFFKKLVPEYCRIQRVQRDVPTKWWSAGVDRTNLRQHIVEEYKNKHTKEHGKKNTKDSTKESKAENKNKPMCRCIRCREPQGKHVNWKKVELKVIAYDASQGKEFFIAAEDPEHDVLIGFARLRFPSERLREEITENSALLRELHVYGTATALDDKDVMSDDIVDDNMASDNTTKAQHRGWGKKLMQKAEEICKEHNKNKLVVISGVGVRGYYRKIGYKKEGMYMVKVL